MHCLCILAYPKAPLLLHKSTKEWIAFAFRTKESSRKKATIHLTLSMTLLLFDRKEGILTTFCPLHCISDREQKSFCFWITARFLNNAIFQEHWKLDSQTFDFWFWFWSLNFWPWIWTWEIGSWTLGLRLWTLDSGPWTFDFGPWTSDFVFWTLIFESRTLEFGLWALDFWFWTLDFWLWILDLKLWTWDFEPLTLGLRLWTLNLGLWTLDFGPLCHYRLKHLHHSVNPVFIQMTND